MEKNQKKGKGGLHSEEQVCPRRENAEMRRLRDSSCRQSEQGRKVFWDAEQSARHLPNREGTCIAS